ncbi:MAG: sugar ABC transporter permease [Phycisphaerae bacterium]|nr:MAG: sugar ABC transporter permease [Phycisphaerae bacterium]
MKRTFRYIVLTLGAAIMVYPFVWMLGAAFKTFAEATRRSLQLFPADWQWQNLAETWGGANFDRFFANTFWVAGWVTLGVVGTALMAGYAFARITFPGRNILFILVLATMMVPFEIVLIPNYRLILELGWYNTYRALIVPWCANGFSIFLVRQAMRGIPSDYFDAARLDGCGHFRFLLLIAAPMIKPTLVTVALFAFLGTYNSLMWPLVVTSDERLRMVQYGLVVFAGGEGAQQFNLLMCAAAIVITPTVILYFAAQRYFQDSALGAGLKG